MSTKATDEPKSKSVVSADLFDCLASFIKPSDKYLEIYGLSHRFFKNRSKFSKQQVRAMGTRMDKFFYKTINSKNTKLDDIVILGEAYHNVCRAYVESDQKEELHFAKDSILHCLNLIRDKELDPKSILLALKSYYCLGFLNHNLSKAKEALQAFNKAVDLYFAYTSGNSENIVVDFQDKSLAQPNDDQQKLTNVYIITLLSLIELLTYIKPTYDPSLIEPIEFLLTAQWNKLSEIEEYFKWINNAMILCAHLLICNRFEEARYYIYAVFFLKRTYIDKKCDCVKDEKIPSGKCEWCDLSINAFNFLLIYQAKYRVALLRESARRLLRLEIDDSETDNLELKDPAKDAARSKMRSLRKSLILPEPEEIYPFQSKRGARRIEYISDYNDAQKTFDNILNILYGGAVYYNKNDTDMYEGIILDACKAYKYMALFEKDTARWMLLQNRRIEILLDAIYYLRLKDRDAMKHLRLQLAIAYLALVDTKFENYRTGDPLFTTSSKDDFIVEIYSLLEKSLLNLFWYAEY